MVGCGRGEEGEEGWSQGRVTLCGVGGSDAACVSCEIPGSFRYHVGSPPDAASCFDLRDILFDKVTVPSPNPYREADNLQRECPPTVTYAAPDTPRSVLASIYPSIIIQIRPHPFSPTLTTTFEPPPPSPPPQPRPPTSSPSTYPKTPPRPSTPPAPHRHPSPSPPPPFYHHHHHPPSSPTPSETHPNWPSPHP